MVGCRGEILKILFVLLLQAHFGTLTDVDDLEVEDTADGCPRDRSEAVAKGRTCLRKCKNDNDCISSRKRCLCDGLCGWSCVRPDLHCEELSPPEFGTVKVTGECFGTRAIYSCEEGYYLSGPRERVCQGDAKWSGHKPECKVKGVSMCGSPPQVPHARHSAPLDKDDFPIEAVVQYNCFPGYDPKGFPKAKCLQYNGTAQWFGPDLRCIPRSCGPLGNIEHGRREGNTFTFTSRVTYHCDVGFELVGRAHRYCQSNGQWSAVLPSCRQIASIECSIPADPPNGRAMYTSVSYNSVVKYECRYGYRLVGPSTRTCNTSKLWEGDDPTCEEIKCDDPGPFYNGYFEGRSYSLGSTVIFHCFDGMKMEGSSATTCRNDGNWSNPIPKCLAPCIVPEMEQGNFTDFSPGARVLHGVEINITCLARYDVIYNGPPVSCNNGTWTHVPSCAPARCRQLPDKPKHGLVIAPKTDHGMKALFLCKDGYQLVGSNVTECHYGEWKNKTPICKEIYCPFPGILEHGRVLLVGYMGMYDYRPYVKKVTNNRQIMYECHRHYTLKDGPPGATCVDGQWSPKQMPRCFKESHPVLTTQRRRRELIRARLRRGGKRRRRGKRIRSKDRNMREACSLQETDWMEVEIVKMGRGNESMPHGTIINVTCTAGYHLNIGNRTAKCMRGRWKPKEPECLTLPCPVPITTNGVYHHFQRAVPAKEGMPHGEVVTLTCLPGFQLTGPDSLRCWYGEWAVESFPECVPKPCELPIILQGHYLSGYRSGLTISHGSSVDYDCKPDYNKITEEPIRCSEGSLRPVPPSCQHHSIKSLTFVSPDGVQETDIRYRQPDGVSGNPSVNNPSAAGYRPCGPPERLQNTLLYPTSKQRGSGMLSDADNSSPTAEGNTARWFAHNTEIRFNCIRGIYGEKTTWKIVCEDGNWVGGAYKCEAEPDPPPDEDRANKSCIFYNTEPNLVAFLDDQLIDEEETEHPPHTELVFRCKDIGKYSLIGSVRRRCVQGDWDGVKPTCYGLSQENDYALEKPPTILFRHQLGPIAQSNEGKLIVYPGTILHLECLWIRKYGIPHWQVSHSYRKYPEGWTNEAGRDPQLEYRLSIYHAQKDDSGRFTCITPMGHRHSVDIIVAAVHCPKIPATPGLHVSNPSTKLDTKVVFSCRDGQTLIGSDQATCLPSSNWSSEPPACQVTECQDLSNVTSEFLRAEVSGRAVGARAIFSCPSGYGLRGEETLQCLDTGQWSADVPFCEEVICERPEIPENGSLQGSNKEKYRGGDVLQFACNDNYMMDGKAIIVCQESSRWSAPVPKCILACPFPGASTEITIKKPQFFYRINETVTFDCNDGLELRGAKMLRCLEGGRWSSSIPSCQKKG
ncbi:sushi, von Willebrand factor type A, EGF and pentraxin domain-containing protein 1-like [Uloborus diversus]|uniref:sushi, von Willebrand factor type A, EGF and pentraxin domain-containing protein 1-like n=1 Tax=Uloborus diversus TaxID=327109 RepID=UPI00240A75EF|nr:sushi, von Willebrand factor type A, EGF and pentraxin domain-containing protein 1-like [Uloborus diversus]